MHFLLSIWIHFCFDLFVFFFLISMIINIILKQILMTFNCIMWTLYSYSVVNNPMKTVSIVNHMIFDFMRKNEKKKFVEKFIGHIIKLENSWPKETKRDRTSVWDRTEFTRVQLFELAWMNQYVCFCYLFEV